MLASLVLALPAFALDDKIEGSCYVECTNAHVDGAEGGNTFLVSFPAYNATAIGTCVSGPSFGTPVPGTYSFAGVREGDGGYRITVNTSGADMYPNHFSALGAQTVGNIKLYLNGSISIQKQSAEPETTSIDPCFSLRAGIFGIFSDEACTNLEATVETDETGRAESQAVIPVGAHWVKELSAPQGFSLDHTALRVQLDASAQQVPHANLTVANKPIRGDASLVKFGASDNGTPSNGVKQPLAGIAFAVVKDSTGGTVARIVTDEQGCASTQALHDASLAGGLPFGDYHLVEDPSSLPAGYAALAPIPFSIKQDGYVQSFILENETGCAVRVIKQNSLTGQNIQGSMTFSILDSNGEPLSFQLTYPANVTTTVLRTNLDGTCLLPQTIKKPGTYYIKELEAPEGYEIRAEPVPFTIDESKALRGFDDPLVATIDDDPLPSPSPIPDDQLSDAIPEDNDDKDKEDADKGTEGSSAASKGTMPATGSLLPSLRTISALSVSSALAIGAAIIGLGNNRRRP